MGACRLRGRVPRPEQLPRLRCELVKCVRKKIPDGEATPVPNGRHHFAIGAQDRKHVLNCRSRLFANAEIDDYIRVDHCIDIARFRHVLEEAIGHEWMAPPPHDPRSEKTAALALVQEEGAVVWERSSGCRECC